MKQPLFKTKATTIFAYLQYLGGLGVLLILIYTDIPEDNEDLIKMLVTALIVSALKDAGQWMYREIDNREQPHFNNDSCSICGKPFKK